MSRKMKDSGIEWIGEIPEEWHIIKVKYLSKLNGRIGWQGLTSNEYQDEGPYLITGTDFKNGEINWNTCVHITNDRYEEAQQIQVQNGDLLITKDGTVGKVAIVYNLDNKASLNSGVLLIRPLEKEQYQTKFLYYVLISNVFWMWFDSTRTGNSTIIHLYQEKFKEFNYPFPKLEEQTRIANYLDRKCTKIDETIEKEKQVIEKLKAYKQSVITEAVTKGLNPDVPMKDSGVEWIREIPEHWEVAKIGNLFNFVSGFAFNSDKYCDETENQIIRIGTVKNDCLVLNNNPVYVDEKYALNAISSRVQEEDILFTMTGTKGKRDYFYTLIIKQEDLLNRKLFLNQRVGCFRKKVNISSNYYNYLLKNERILDSIFIYETGTANQGNLGIDTIRRTKVHLPPLREQIEIANYLDNKCSKIESTIAKKETLIQRLIEYKKSLIYECVTGKREV